RPAVFRPVGQAGPQARCALAVQLTDPGLADAQHRADFLEIQLLVVIQRQYQSLPFRQFVDCLGQRLAKSRVLQPLEGRSLGFGFAGGPGLPQLVEAEQPAVRRVAENRMIFLETHIQFGRNLMIFSVTANTGLDGTNGAADQTRVAMDRAGGPIALAYIIQHGATYADAGIGLEAGPLSMVELASGLEQAEHAGLNQI